MRADWLAATERTLLLTVTFGTGAVGTVSPLGTAATIGMSARSILATSGLLPLRTAFIALARRSRFGKIAHRFSEILR